MKHTCENLDKDWQPMVAAFMTLFNHAINEGPPAIASYESMQLGNRLIAEEWQETRDSMVRKDMVGIADGIGDTIYTLLGLACRYGIDMAPVMAEIHRANMAKVGGPVVNGKQMKPAGWTPPDIAGVLKAQGWKE